MFSRKPASFLLVLCLVSSFLLTACGGNGPGSSSNNGPIKLTFSIWGNEFQMRMYQEMAQRFKEKHPNITVQVQVIPFADYQQKLSIAVASKTAPDVAWVAERMLPQLMAANQIMDISAVKNDASYKYGDIYESTQEILKKGNQLFGIPFSTSPSIFFYNKTLFKEKNLKTPTELYQEGRWTYDEMLKAAREITDPSKGIYGAKLTREWKNWPDGLMPLIWAQGGDLFNKNGDTFALNSPAGERALQLYSDVIFKDQAHPKPGDQTTFETGKLGMFVDRYSYVSKVRPITDFEWDIAPMPAGPSGSIPSLGLAAYTVMQGTKYPNEAMEFLKFVSNEENMGTAAQFFVPSRASVLQGDSFVKAAPQPTVESIQLAVLDQFDKARPNPVHRNWARIDDVVLKQLDRLYTRSASVKEVLSSMEQEINPLLK